MSGVGIGGGSWTTGTQSVVQNYMGDMMIGIQDASKLTLAVNDGTRTLTVAPVAGPYFIYSDGNKLEISTTKTAVWPDATGINYFYFDAAGALQVTSTFDISIITKYAFVSILYWDKDAAKHIYWGDERHGIYMAPMTHAYLHSTSGARFDRGLSLTGFSVDGTGNDNANAQFTSNSGVIWDEDIKIAIPAQTQIPIMYKSGTTWKRKGADSFPVIYTGTAGYAGTRLPYNQNVAGNWQLTEVDDNKFVLVHILATNDIEYPVMGIQGIAQYVSKAAARAGSNTELQSLSGLPFAEFTPLGSVIFQTNSLYANTPKALIVSTDDGANYEDKRATYFRPDTL